MVSYGMAKARAMANRADWNERTEITKAVITWVDEENAEDLAKADAEENGTTFEEIDRIAFKEDYIDDDALFDEAYEAACEFEWESMTGR